MLEVTGLFLAFDLFHNFFSDERFQDISDLREESRTMSNRPFKLKKPPLSTRVYRVASHVPRDVRFLVKVALCLVFRVDLPKIKRVLALKKAFGVQLLDIRQ